MRAIVGFLGIWLAYLIVANGLLWSRAALRLAAGADSAVAVRYRLAWTVWPAKLAAQDLRLELPIDGHDLHLAFEQVRFDVSLAALAAGRVVIRDLRGNGLSLRIASRAGAGPTPWLPPPTENGAPAWAVEIDDGCAGLRDLAFDDLQLLGATKICGGFRVARRAVAVDEARADVDGALLLIDGDLVGADLRGTVTASLSPCGLDDALRSLSLEADLAMKTVTVDALARRLGSPVALGGGSGRLRLVAAIAGGRLASGAYAVLELDELSARRDSLVLQGERVVAQVLGNGSWLTTTVEAVGRARLGERWLDFDRVALSVDMPLEVDPARPRAHLDLSAHAATLAGLGAADDEAAVIRGRAWLELHVDVAQNGEASGEVVLHGESLAARWGDTLFEGDAAARLRLRGDLPDNHIDAAAGRIAVEGRVSDADAPYERWKIAAHLLEASGSERAGRARAAIEIGTLRPLASLPLLRNEGLGLSLAALEGVRAAVVARWRPSGLTFTLLHARSARASACGSWRFEDHERGGAALVEIGRDAWGITMGRDGPSVTRAPDDAWRHRHLEPRRLVRAQ